MVPRSLLIIGHEVWKSEDSAAGFLSREQDWCVARSSWVALTPEARRQASADLIMAVAVGHADRAMDFFQWLRMNPIDSRTFAVLPAEADLDTFQISLEAIDDFVLWPTRQDELRYRVARILGDHRQETQSLNARLNEELGLAQLIGNDSAFVQIVRRIPLFARSDAPVLITGETGTGKEMCARAIHHITRRRDLPLIPVDWAGIPYELFENELFGHARGAFTDARGEQKGLAAMAQGGTLFLDEIDALPLTVQAKLLRFLQEGTYKPLGADRFVRSDVRIIAATNRDIEAMMREGHFRSDLYYRLNVLRLELPPLRQRRSDIALLARHFLSSLCHSSGSMRKSFTPSALQKLASYHWPGNVRELHNVIQRSFVISEGTQILPCHISIPTVEVAEKLAGCFREARARMVEAFERRYVEEMIRKHSGNVTKAASEAGKERRTFGRLLKKYGINRVLFDPQDGASTAHLDKPY